MSECGEEEDDESAHFIGREKVGGTEEGRRRSLSMILPFPFSVSGAAALCKRREEGRGEGRGVQFSPNLFTARVLRLNDLLCRPRRNGRAGGGKRWQKVLRTSIHVFAA